LSVQIKNLSEKIAVESSRGLRWRPPLLIFYRVVSTYGDVFFSTEDAVHGASVTKIIIFMMYMNAFHAAAHLVLLESL
jgi:hypothetical protein